MMTYASAASKISPSQNSLSVMTVKPAKIRSAIAIIIPIMPKAFFKLILPCSPQLSRPQLAKHQAAVSSTFVSKYQDKSGILEL